MLPSTSRTCLPVDELLDKHKGQMAFILGAGPSLRLHDMSSLDDYVTFTVNSSIVKKPDCDYFVTDDSASANWSWFRETAVNSRCTKFLHRAKLSERAYFFPEDEVVLYDHVSQHSPDFDPKSEEGYELTKDGYIVASRTSVGSALHIAWLMGCDRIVLLGCDACYTDNKRYFWQFDGEPRPHRTDSRVVRYQPNRPSVENQQVDLHCLEFCKYWDKIAAANPGIQKRVLYVSEHGLVKSFPKTTLQQALKDFGDRTIA